MVVMKVTGEPTITITDGTLTLGHVFERAGGCIATDAGMNRLGTFPTRAAAVKAVHDAKQQVTT